MSSTVGNGNCNSWASKLIFYPTDNVSRKLLLTLSSLIGTLSLRMSRGRAQLWLAQLAPPSPSPLKMEAGGLQVLSAGELLTPAPTVCKVLPRPPRAFPSGLYCGAPNSRKEKGKWRWREFLLQEGFSIVMKAPKLRVGGLVAFGVGKGGHWHCYVAFIIYTEKFLSVLPLCQHCARHRMQL